MHRNVLPVRGASAVDTTITPELRELESNQRPPDSESGVTTSSNCPAASFHRGELNICRGSGKRIRTFIACFKDRRPTISRSPRVPCGSRTRLAGLEGRHLCRSAKGTMNSSCGGRNRTCVTAVNSRLPVPTRAPPHQAVNEVGLKVGVVGFEPTVSCSRSTRISRLSYTPLKTSTQRESNPHFRPGEAAGCRYNMGAIES